MVVQSEFRVKLRPRPSKKKSDTVTGGSVLASGAQPPASVANFFRWTEIEPCDDIS